MNKFIQPLANCISISDLINYATITMGGATTKIQGGGHKWNKFGSFGWRNILNGLGQAFLQDFGPRVVRPNREGVDFMKKYRRGSAKFIFGAKNRLLSEKSLILSEKLEFSSENQQFQTKNQDFKRKIVVLSEKSLCFNAKTNEFKRKINILSEI